MSHCKFDIAVKNIPAALDDLRAHVDDLDGNERAGAFVSRVPLVGLVAGSYTVTGNVVTVKITSKPLLLGCGVIQASITEFLSKH